MSAPAPAQISAVVDQGDGTYTADLTAASCLETGTAIQVAAQIGAVAMQTQIALSITCVPVSSAQSSVALSATTVVRCEDASRDQVQVTVVPRDASGQPLDGDGAVSIDNSAGALIVGAFTRVGDAFVGSVTSSSCGPTPVPILVLANGVAIGSPQLAVAFTCPVVDPAQSGIQINETSLPANGIAAATVAVSAMTTCGEPARGRPVVLAAKLGALIPAAGETDSAGAFVSQLSSAKSGTDQITGTVDGVELKPATIQYVPGGRGGCSSSSEPPLLTLAAALALLWRRRQRHV